MSTFCEHYPYSTTCHCSCLSFAGSRGTIEWPWVGYPVRWYLGLVPIPGTVYPAGYCTVPGRACCSFPGLTPLIWR